MIIMEMNGTMIKATFQDDKITKTVKVGNANANSNAPNSGELKIYYNEGII